MKNTQAGFLTLGSLYSLRLPSLSFAKDLGAVASCKFRPQLQRRVRPRLSPFKQRSRGSLHLDIVNRNYLNFIDYRIGCQGFLFEKMQLTAEKKKINIYLSSNKMFASQPEQGCTFDELVKSLKRLLIVIPAPVFTGETTFYKTITIYYH